LPPQGFVRATIQGRDYFGSFTLEQLDVEGSSSQLNLIVRIKDQEGKSHHLFTHVKFSLDTHMKIDKVYLVGHVKRLNKQDDDFSVEETTAMLNKSSISKKRTERDDIEPDSVMDDEDFHVTDDQRNKRQRQVLLGNGFFFQVQ
jgi:hypothetical protein